MYRWIRRASWTPDPGQIAKEERRVRIMAVIGVTVATLLELTGLAQRAARGDWTITDPLLARYLADLPGA